MGLSFSSTANKKQILIAMTGINGSGKTTILYKLKLGKIIETTPTIGYNIENIDHKNICFRILDQRGGPRILPEFCRYFQGSEGVIYVVDSTDKECLEEAHAHLNYLLKDENLQGAALLIYANKQDLPNAMTPVEIADKLELYKIHNRVWYVQVASALEGKGLHDGLNWLFNVLTAPKQITNNNQASTIIEKY